MTAAFSFGPLGTMKELKVQAGLSQEREGNLSRFTTSGGVSYFQRPRRAPRSWAVARRWQDPVFAKLLERAAHGLLGEVFLYDRATARRNMLPSELTSGTGVPVMVDGAPMPAVTWTSLQVPLLAGRTYTLSAWGTIPESPLEATFPNLALGPLPAPDGRGLSQVTFTPATDGMLALSRDSQVVAGVRVHEGIPDGRFYATSGTPCLVAVEIPVEAYQLVTDQDTRIDFEVTLRETGRTGHYA